MTLATYQWQADQLKQAVEGTWLGEDTALSKADGLVFTSVSTDSRTLIEGALYIAIVGERFDGHAFIDQAIDNGARLIMVSDANAEAVKAARVPMLHVADTRLALGQFSAWHRRSMPLNKLIAITGSNGKTTTKTLIAHLLQKQVGEDQVCYTQGNLNNDFGVPRTLLSLRPHHQYGVIEMGANHRNEIRYLTHLAGPDVALITLAAGAHLEGFGSLDGVIEAKGEIFEGLNAAGIGVLNQDSPGAAQWREKLTKQHNTVLTFAHHSEADVRVDNITSDRDGIEFDCRYLQETAHIKMPILGPHNAMNAAAAVSACLALGLSWSQILPGLVDFQGVSGRVQQYEFSQGVLIDDSYNANPSSVRAAIDTLVNLPGPTVLCLGAMAELGAETEQAHRDVIAYAKAQQVDYLCLFGEATRSMSSVFGENAEWFETHQAIAEKVLKLKADGKINHCLVKGSRSSQMEKVTAILLENIAGITA